MFDVVGYWGILTINLMSPVALLAMMFGNHTNQRLKALGGKRIELFAKYDKFFSGWKLKILIAYSVLSALVAVVWMFNECGTSFLAFHSYLAETCAPYIGWLFVVLAALGFYEFMLRLHVKISKL